MEILARTRRGGEKREKMAVRLEKDFEILDGYRLVRPLGRGGFGEVWEAEAPGGLMKAVKVAPLENTEGEGSSRELEGLKKIRAIRHPFLLSIERYEIIESSLVIVMELADKSLADRYDECCKEGLPGIPREELLRYMQETSEALDLLNDHHGLQHLDVKPTNIFLAAGHVKVADFGLVQPRNTSISISALAFSPPYAPPELFDGRIEGTADQYGLAVTYQELLTGCRPYTAIDVRGIIFQHLKGKPELSLLPPSDRPIVQQAISRDTTQRYPNCGEFVNALKKANAFGPPSVNLGGFKSTKPGLQNVPTESARPLFIRNPNLQRAKVSTQIKTSAIGSRPATIVLGQGENGVGGGVGNEVNFRSTFLAFLPLEIYAHKLRGFIDELGAEVINCTDEKMVMMFRTRSWLGMKTKKGLFMEIDACARTPNSGYRVVDVSIWSSGQQLKYEELARRGRVLVAYLKSFLMASDKNTGMKSGAQIRAEILD